MQDDIVRTIRIQICGNPSLNPQPCWLEASDPTPAWAKLISACIELLPRPGSLLQVYYRRDEAKILDTITSRDPSCPKFEMQGKCLLESKRYMRFDEILKQALIIVWALKLDPKQSRGEKSPDHGSGTMPRFGAPKLVCFRNRVLRVQEIGKWSFS